MSLTRGRGRPPVGPRITVRVDADLLAWLDQQRARNQTRADVIRHLLNEARNQQ